MPDHLDDEPERSRWAYVFGGTLAAVFISITAVGSVVVVQGMDDPQTTTLTSARPTPSATPAPTPSATEEPEAAPTGRIARSPEEVLAKTKYVKRYRDGMPDISRKHPDIGKNGLANHGATMCAMIEDRKTSVFDLVRVFMLDFHAHPGPVTEQKALLAADIAVQEACPDLAARWREKLEL